MMEMIDDKEKKDYELRTINNQLMMILEDIKLNNSPFKGYQTTKS